MLEFDFKKSHKMLQNKNKIENSKKKIKIYFSLPMGQFDRLRPLNRFVSYIYIELKQKNPFLVFCCSFVRNVTRCDARIFWIGSANMCLVLNNATDKLSTQLVLVYCWTCTRHSIVKRNDTAARFSLLCVYRCIGLGIWCESSHAKWKLCVF